MPSFLLRTAFLLAAASAVALGAAPAAVSGQQLPVDWEVDRDEGGMQAAAFAAESAELKANIAALTQAIAALEKGVTGGFLLQTRAASVLRRLTLSVDMSSTDRDMVSSFLAQNGSAGYIPQSAEIIGILKQMKMNLDNDLLYTEPKDTATKAHGKTNLDDHLLYTEPKAFVADAAPSPATLSDMELAILRDLQDSQDMQDTGDLDEIQELGIHHAWYNELGDVQDTQEIDEMQEPPRRDVAADEAFMRSAWTLADPPLVPAAGAPLGRRPRRRLMEAGLTTSLILAVIAALAACAFRWHLALASPYVGPRTSAFALLCCPLVLLFPIDERGGAAVSGKLAQLKAEP